MTSPKLIQAQGDGSTNYATSETGKRSVTKAQWIDLGVVVVLITIAMLGFQPPFGGYWFLLAIGGGLVIGLGAALLGYTLRLNVLNTVLLAIAAYFLFGTAFTMPTSGFFGVLPTLQTLGALAVGAVFSWRDMVTLVTPIEGPDHVNVLPYVATLIVTLVASLLVLRWLQHHRRSAGRAAVVLIGPALLFLLTVLTGTHQPFLAIVRGIAFALIAIVWLGWRRGVDNVASTEARAGLRKQRLVGTAIMGGAALAIAGIVGVLVMTPLTNTRLVLREEVTPPFDPYEYESPLAGFREYTKLLNETTLFNVTGLQPGDKLRLATLDQYTGKKWQIVDPELEVPGTGSYNLVGRDVPQTKLLTTNSNRHVQVVIDNYNDIWLPTIGSPSRLELIGGTLPTRKSELRFNGETGAGVITGGLSSGDVYTLIADIQNVPLEGQLDNVPIASGIGMPPSQPAPASLVESMQSFISGETSPYLQLKAIEQALQSQGYLSHGTASDMAPSRAGHGLDRMQELFDLEFMVGDGEQYASAMALMAQELGYPARVVVGFAPENIPDNGAGIDVRGKDVTAWVEVPFEGFGWVAFSPTPDQTDVPVNTTTQPQTKPQAQVRQPPQTEARPDELITAADRPGDNEEDEEEETLPAWLIGVGLAVIIPLLMYLIPLAIFALMRAARKRRRRRKGEGDARVAGAWDETLDRFAELGYAIPERETRSVRAATMHPELSGLATLTDRVVFGGGAPSDAEIEDVWEEAERITKHAAKESSPWRRQWAKFRYHRSREGKKPSVAQRVNGRMTAERAQIRNQVLRSGGEAMPDLEQIARVEGVAVPRLPQGTVDPASRDARKQLKAEAQRRAKREQREERERQKAAQRAAKLARKQGVDARGGQPGQAGPSGGPSQRIQGPPQLGDGADHGGGTAK